MVPFPRPVRAVVFDLDGVLLDSEPLYTQATDEIIAEFGVRFDWSVKADMIGRAAIESARHLIHSYQLPISPEEYLARRRPILERLFLDTPPMPGAEKLLAALRVAGVPHGIGTSSERRLFTLKTTHHPWLRAVPVIVCGDEVPAVKPAPDIFLRVAERLGVDPTDCLVVEDSAAGVTAARAAGMMVVAMPDPHLDVARYANADAVIGHLGELDVSTFV